MRTVTVLVGTETDHHPEDREAWTTGVPALAVTADPDVSGWYRLTHIPTGRSVGSYFYQSIAAARRTARRLSFYDWAAHVGGHNSITGSALVEIRTVCMIEGKHPYDVFWGTP